MAREHKKVITKAYVEDLRQRMEKAQLGSEEETKLMLEALEIILRHIDASIRDGSANKRRISQLGAGDNFIGKIRGGTDYEHVKIALYWIIGDLLRDIQRDLE